MEQCMGAIAWGRRALQGGHCRGALHGGALHGGGAALEGSCMGALHVGQCMGAIAWRGRALHWGAMHRPHWSHPCRLERLQRIVTKLQTEAGLCEEQLNQADALLQAVSAALRGCGAWCRAWRHMRCGAACCRAAWCNA